MSTRQRRINRLVTTLHVSQRMRIYCRGTLPFLAESLSPFVLRCSGKADGYEAGDMTACKQSCFPRATFPVLLLVQSMSSSKKMRA